MRESTLGTVHQVLKHVVKTYRARNSRGSHDHEDMLSIFNLLKSYIKSELQEAEQKHEKEPALAVGDALVRSFWLSFWCKSYYLRDYLLMIAKLNKTAFFAVTTRTSYPGRNIQKAGGQL